MFNVVLFDWLIDGQMDWCDVLTVEVEWWSSGDVGDSADADVPDAVC